MSTRLGFEATQVDMGPNWLSLIWIVPTWVDMSSSWPNSTWVRCRLDLGPVPTPFNMGPNLGRLSSTWTRVDSTWYAPEPTQFDMGPGRLDLTWAQARHWLGLTRFDIDMGRLKLTWVQTDLARAESPGPDTRLTQFDMGPYRLVSI